MPTIGEVLAYRRRLIGAILCFAAAVLIVVATFLPLVTGEATFDGETERAEVTSWGFPGDEDSAISSPKYGFPMVFAATIMLAAAVTLLVSALPSVRLGTGRAAASITLAGSAVLVGLTWGVTLYGALLMDSLEAAGDGPGDTPVDTDLGAGFWLLIAGLVLAVAATVLVKLPNRRAWPGAMPQFNGRQAGAAGPYPAILDPPTQPMVLPMSPNQPPTSTR